MTNRPLIVAPSILGADLGRIEAEAKRIQESGAEWVHVDIMDGHFVPNISFGVNMVRTLRRLMGEATLDVHLMIEQPDRYANEFIEAGADCLNIHLEARHQSARTLASIREKGCRTGLALNPATLLKHAVPLLPLCDQLLCMTVNPGFGGQPFLSEVLPKIREAREIILRQNVQVDISVDGGINNETAAQCVASGANILVSGSYLFSQPDLTKAVTAMRSAATAANVSG
ncbi:MAG: ribulose-phosphate 3-epimerase [Verrucomicrobiia bacterium Tous-C5FEB]|jgi:ribulose-phosphate 3-epimerase|nr:MAG: ribulose-phosphate 3-epimerase [Verrucomicrobiae bacterium Tous-C5FEB]